MPSPLPQLPPRAADAHKGDFSRLLLIGGSRGMSGAISLAGMAALRAGAGLVQLATADVCQPIVAGLHPVYMTLALPSDRQGRISLRAIDPLLAAGATADILALGPGLGRSPGLDVLVCRLYREIAAPMVVDADALNALAERKAPLGEHKGPRILTPHPGEFGRLVPDANRAPRGEMEKAAERLASSAKVVIVLKGHRTLITDGRESQHNTTGNPGMATGGTGDVLTGVIAALLGQGLNEIAAARLGTHLHGAAGDLAAARLGQVSLLPTDLIDALPESIIAAGSSGVSH